MSEIAWGMLLHCKMRKARERESRLLVWSHGIPTDSVLDIFDTSTTPILCPR